MAKDSNAITRVEELHANNNGNNNPDKATENTYGPDNNVGGPGMDGKRAQDLIKQRARVLINNRAIDVETRSILRYGLEIDDPILEELVCMVERGESLDYRLRARERNPSDEFITTHRSRNDLMNSARDEERSAPRAAQKGYSIEYEPSERESMLDHERDEEFPDDSANDLTTEAGNGNGGGSGTGNV